MKEYQKDWDGYATLINSRKDAPQWAVLKKARQTHWDVFFKIKSGQKVLDAGCGHGDYSILALESGADVWAFDFSQTMTDCTRARIKEQGLAVKSVTRHSVLNIPYENHMFDTAFCLAVLDHLSLNDQKRAMAELYRILKPGGMLYIDVPNRFAFHWRLIFEFMRLAGLYPAGAIKFFSPMEINALIRKCGFKIRDRIGLTIIPPFSGIYTTDLRRITILPEHIIQLLDKLYLKIEISFRKMPFFIPFCWHHFIKAQKPESV